MTYGGSRNFQNWAKPMNTVISISARRRNLCINPEADLQPAKIVNQSFVHHYRCDLFSFWKFGQPNEPPRLPECGVHTAGLPCNKKKTCKSSLQVHIASLPSTNFIAIKQQKSGHFFMATAAVVIMTIIIKKTCSTRKIRPCRNLAEGLGHTPAGFLRRVAVVVAENSKPLCMLAVVKKNRSDFMVRVVP